MRIRSLVVPVTLLAAAAVGCGTSSPAPITVLPAAGSSSQPSACRTADLSVRLGSPQGAAGSVYAPLVFTNTGDGSCRLAGYPGVSYVAPHSGHQVGAAASRNPQHPARTVTLAPGGHAAAVVQMVAYQNYPRSKCAPTRVSGLRVYPPNNTAAKYVAFGSHRSACSTKVSQLTVEAVVRGASGT